MKKVFKCHKISEGCVEAEVTISKDDIMFYLIDPDNGIMLEPAHDLKGRTMSKKILVFPSGKGSSVVQADGLFQLMKKNNHPSGMIVERAETVLVSSAIVFEIPMVDKVDSEFYETIKEGDKIKLDATNEEISIL
ncbi:MAG: aconitase X swivel domain-containing protein [Peptoniphilaceae bacterium]